MELQEPHKQAVKMHMNLHFSMESIIRLTEISLLRKETHMLSELIYLANKKKKLHKDMNISSTDLHCALSLRTRDTCRLCYWHIPVTVYKFS